MSVAPSDCEVSVVIGTYSRKPFLQATLASVRDELDGLQHEIIVIDGGSEDGTVDWLVRQKDVIAMIQHNRGEWHGRPIERRSWGYFMNLGFKAAHGRLVCMLSDDCLVVPGAIRHGIARYDGLASAGESVGAVAFYWRNWPQERTYKVGLTFGNRMFVNHGLYVRTALEEVGFIDEDGFTFYHADGDLSLRLWDRGYRCVDAPASFVEHYLDANHSVRASNVWRQGADWTTYRNRWARLGEPSRDWIDLAFDDTHDTVRVYWGRRLTSPAYRRMLWISAVARERYSRIAAAKRPRE